MKKLFIIGIILTLIFALSCTKQADKKTGEISVQTQHLNQDHTYEEGHKCEDHDCTDKHGHEKDSKCEGHDCKDKAVVDHHHCEIEWGTDIDAALGKAAETGKIVMVDFMADWCPPCRKMEKETFPDHDVVHKAKNFIPVRIDVDDNQEVANKYNGNAGKYGGKGIPNILFMDKEKKTIRHIVGFHSPEKLVSVMDSVLTGKYQ